MPGTYIPPHLRNKTGSESKPEDLPPTHQASSKNFTVYDISNHFWPTTNDEGELSRSYDSHGKTLHDSAATPHRLAYVLLFSGANPKWETNGVIYTKSSLDLLPSPLAGKASKSLSSDPGSSTVPTEDEHQPVTVSRDPIAVFKQLGTKSKTHGFTFEGWYNIKRVSFLEPRSDELVKMLEAKWTLTDGRGNEYLGTRDAQSWKQSLNLRWAMVEFAKDDKAQEERGKAEIERLPPEQRQRGNSTGPKKSVNELLAEMRVKDSAPAASECG